MNSFHFLLRLMISSFLRNRFLAKMLLFLFLMMSGVGFLVPTVSAASSSSLVAATYTMQPNPTGDRSSGGGLPIFGQNKLDLPKLSGNNSQSMFATLVMRVINLIKILLQAIAVGYIIIVGSEMVMNMSNEELLKKKQNTFLYALFGFIIINIGELAFSIFNPATSGSSLIDKSAFLQFLNLVINLIKFSMGTVALVLIVMTGFKILSPRSTNIDGEKKHLTAVATGLFVVVIADLVQRVFIPSGYELTPGVPTEATSSAARGSELILNIGGALLYVMGPIALFFMILAGYYYVTAAGSPDKIKKANGIFVGTIIAVIIAYSAYALVSEVIRNVIFA